MMRIREKCKSFLETRSNRNAIVAVAVLLICAAVLAGTVQHRYAPQKDMDAAAEYTESENAESTAAEVMSAQDITTAAVTAAAAEQDISTACAHDFKIKVVAPTCTERGHTEHVCTKCGQWFWDAFTPARHQYGKYLCEICGAPDPSDPIHSLCAWLRTYGTLNGNGTYRSISSGDITIYTSEYFHNRDYIYIDKVVETEESSEIFRIFFDTSGVCHISYILSLPHSSVTASVTQGIGDTGVLPITTLTEYHNSTGNGKTQAEYIQFLNQELVPILKRAERELLTPKTELTLQDFGFRV